MNFNQYLAKYICGNLLEQEYPEFAIQAILKGHDSKYLRILAAMNENDEKSELRKYFKWSYTELQITKPNAKEAALTYSIGIIENVFENKKDIISGLNEIINKALIIYGFYDDFNEYSYKNIEFEQLYILFIQYEEILIINQINKEKHLKNLTDKISIELKKWYKKLSTTLNKSNPI